MNVLFTESSFDMGGQELQAIAQLQQLKLIGHSVLLACRPGSKISQDAISKEIDVVFISFKNSIHIPSVLSLCHEIYRFRPDIVVCHSGHDSNIVGISRFFIIGKARAFKIIRQKTYLTSKVKTFSLNYLCDMVVVPSYFTKESLVNRGCDNEIRVVHPGFNVDIIRKASRLSLPAHIMSWLKKKKDIPVFLQVGMIRPEKGHIFMLDVLSTLRQQGREFCWLIVGSGSSEDENKLRSHIKRYKMQDYILTAGSVFPVFPVYKVASLVVIPSTNESFGMVAVEASLNTVPVFANNIGGLSDVIKDKETGTLLLAGDKELWVKSLGEFLDNSEPFYNMASLAKEDVELRFNIRNTIRDIIE